MLLLAALPIGKVQLNVSEQCIDCSCGCSDGEYNEKKKHSVHITFVFIRLSSTLLAVWKRKEDE